MMAGATAARARRVRWRRRLRVAVQNRRKGSDPKRPKRRRRLRRKATFLARLFEVLEADSKVSPAEAMLRAQGVASGPARGDLARTP